MSGGKKILVVEDEMIVAQNIRRGLERIGYEVLGPAGNAEDGLRVATEQKPDLILMDIKLGDNSDGIELTRELNRQMDVPVIYITALTDQETIKRAKETAPYGYIQKPFSENEIRTTIEMALFKHEKELEISRNESIFSTTLKSIEDALITADTNLVITYANVAAGKLLETDAGQLAGENLEHVCKFKQGEGKKNWDVSYSDLMKKHEREYLPEDCLIVGSTGETTPVTGSISTILDDQENIEGVVVVLRDVTREREEAEKEQVRKRLEKIGNDIRSRLISDTSPEMVTVLELLAEAVRADRAYISLYPENTNKQNSQYEVIEWINPDLDKKVTKILQENEKSGSWWVDQVFRDEPLIYANIDELPDVAESGKDTLKQAGVKSLAAFPFRSAETGYSGFVGLNWTGEPRECTQMELNALSMMSNLVSSHVVRSKAEEMLRDSEYRFRTLIQKSSDIIMVLCPDQSFLYISPSTEKILGYKNKELEGKNVFSFVHDEDRSRAERAFRKVMEDSQQEIVVEYRFQHKDGHWVYLESVGSNMTDDPAIGGVVINSRDITDRKAVEEELIHARDSAEEMNRVKTALLANMSHEMRTPLTGILGFASILEVDLPEGEARDMAERIHISGRRLLETIESILDLAKLESEKLDMESDRVNIIDEIRKALETHVKSAEHKGISYEIRTDIRELYLDIDRQFFNRAMYNLLSNAFKYTQEGKVTVYVSKTANIEGNWVKIDVEDTGVGISPDFLPKVFEEFQQESTGFSRKFEGTGLGLTITRKLVEVMGGKISVKSEKGKGSVFTVLLPVIHDEDKPIASSPGMGRRQYEGKPRVLLVEDDFDSSVITKFYLSKVYDVEVVDSGEKALEVLSEKTFETIILDISLGPGMDGVSTLKAIRRDSTLSKLPAIALTAHAMSGDAEYYLDKGFSAYLAKPFRKDELMELVAGFVKKVR